MNRIEKLLKKLSGKERVVIKSLILKIHSGNYKGLDIKKLKGDMNLFRIRKGDIRIIFSTDESINILSISRRNDTTYNL